jgi:ArsR family transcriptional regulator
MSNTNNDELDRLPAAFAALSNPQRLRMFVKLATTGCGPGGRRAARDPKSFCCASDVGKGLGLAASTVSHHLKELRQAGLMHVERHGRRIDCWASQETLERLASFFSTWTEKPAPTKSGTATRKAVVQRGAGR